jgi:acyl-CoA hydrolase
VSPRTCTPAEAAALVRPVDSIGFGLGPANPHALLTALGERDDWEDLVLGGALWLDYYRVLENPSVSYRCGFFGPAERLHAAAGHRVELVAGGFRQMGPILARYHPRIMTAQATPPDASGSLSLSLHFGATRAELLAAGSDPDRTLIVEINPNLPRTAALPGYDNTLPLELVDVLVEADHDPYALPEDEPNEIDAAIASLALGYVQDGSTLQTGIGGIPTMVATALSRGSGGDFGVHSEMFTTGLMRLHQAGKVTNRSKGQFEGVSVTTFALGTAELHRWLDGNTEVAFAPVGLVNDPTVIAGNRRFVAVNGAMSVDLYGQVVADAISGRQVSGVGGHEDFAAAADLNLEAHSLICLHSTAIVGGLTVSRIVAELPGGSVVSTPRHHAGTIITEYGTAELAGRTVGERARALAAIAHPDFRDQLTEAAGRLGRS